MSKGSNENCALDLLHDQSMDKSKARDYQKSPKKVNESFTAEIYRNGKQVKQKFPASAAMNFSHQHV